MPTPIYLTGWEHGIISTSGGGIADGNSGALIGSPEPGGGANSLRLFASGTAATLYWWKNDGAGSATKVGRFYFKFVTFPNVAIPIYSLATVSGFTNNITAMLQSTTAGVISWTKTLGTAGSNTFACSLNTWYYIDFRATNVGTATWTVEWSVNGVTQGTETISGQTAGASGQYHKFGSAISVNSVIMDLLIDHFIVSNTSADYPIGAGKITALSPIDDLVDSTGFQDSSSVAISGTNKAYQYLDDSPLPSGAAPATDFVKQVTASINDVIYMKMAALADNVSPVNGVEGLLAYGGASATANLGCTAMGKLDTGNNYSAITNILGVWSTSQADMSETSVFYKSACSAAFSLSDAGSNLTWIMTIGQSTDVSPVPQWQALMMEVDQAVVAALPETRKIKAMQAVNRAACF